jgi:enamine deaminase RidA (YjgF/YER057c/UK114 family)
VPGWFAGADVASQTCQAVANTVAVLAAARATLAGVVQLREFLCDLADFSEMNRLVAELVPEPFPARTTVCVGLPKDVRMDIGTLAVVGQFN